MQSLGPYRTQLLLSFRQHKPAIFVILAMLMVAVTLVILMARLKSARNTPEVTYSTSAPSEKKPDGNYRWQGSPNDPKRIIISSLSLDGYVQNVGIDQNKAVAVPNNIHIAGWFTESVRPGEKGLSIIDGHVDGQKSDGIFSGLASIKPGALVGIEYGNGSKKEFRVMRVEEVDEAKAASVLFSQSPKSTNQLNLITCSGNFNKGTKRYEKRVVVSTELAPQG